MLQSNRNFDFETYWAPYGTTNGVASDDRYQFSFISHHVHAMLSALLSRDVEVYLDVDRRRTKTREAKMSGAGDYRVQFLFGRSEPPRSIGDVEA